MYSCYTPELIKALRDKVLLVKAIIVIMDDLIFDVSVF